MALEVEPDLTAMGKMIGGGFPVGGVAGRADVMDLMNPKETIMSSHTQGHSPPTPSA